MHKIGMPVEYHVYDAMLECCQSYTPKPIKVAELKDCFVYDNG